MNLVFKAGGLNVGEGAFLMACANHTDDKGYVIASMQQLADEANMSLRSAQDQKARLTKRNLLRIKERYNPKNNAQIANLFRINLDLLKSMERPPKDYGPSLVEELSFDAPQESPEEPQEEKPSSDPHADSAPGGGADLAPPHADLAPPHADLAGGGGADLAPLLLPSSVPSSLSDAEGPAESGADAASGGREREAATPADNSAEVVVRAYATAAAVAGRPVLPERLRELKEQAATLLAAGTQTEWLAARAAEMPARGWVDLIKHAHAWRPESVAVPGQNRAAGAPRADVERAMAERLKRGSGL